MSSLLVNGGDQALKSNIFLFFALVTSPEMNAGNLSLPVSADGDGVQSGGKTGSFNQSEPENLVPSSFFSF